MKFVDSTILLHAFGPDDASIRPSIARDLLSRGDLALSHQVLQEFHVLATHPGRRDPLTGEEAAEVIESLMAFPVLADDSNLLREACTLRNRFSISFWDANILAAARKLDCDILFSEGLVHDRNYGGITVLDPFALLPD